MNIKKKFNIFSVIMSYYNCICGSKIVKGTPACHYLCTCGEKIKLGEERCHEKRRCYCGELVIKGEEKCHTSEQCVCGKLIKTGGKSCHIDKRCNCGKFISSATGLPCHKKCKICNHLYSFDGSCEKHHTCSCKKILPISKKICHVKCEFCPRPIVKGEICKCRINECICLKKLEIGTPHCHYACLNCDENFIPAGVDCPKCYPKIKTTYECHCGNINKIGDNCPKCYDY